jgi:hypothetical protein
MTFDSGTIAVSEGGGYYGYDYIRCFEKWVDKLKTPGFPQDQAEAVVRRVVAEAQDEWVTKAYLDSALEKALGSIGTDQAVLKWMMGCCWQA